MAEPRDDAAGALVTDHLVCRACGRTDGVACPAGPRPCPEPSATAGFLVDRAEVVFWGLCPECQGGV